MATPLKDNAYRMLHQRLISGRLPPGSRVSESALSEELGISRGPIREAITRLVSEGLVEQVPNSGSFVRKPDRRDLEDLYELREWLEDRVVAEAAAGIAPEQLEELERVCREVLLVAREHRNSAAEFLEGAQFRRAEIADLAFHMTLIGACRNRLMIKIIADHQILSQVWSFLQNKYDLRALARLYREHAQIMKAVRRGDVEAARSHMREHIRRSRQRALSGYDWQQRELAVGGRGKEYWPESLQRLISLVEG